ncbi:TPA: hypothetical protein ACH3X2_000800, partial [Trebouxia sp. C0005]
LVGLDMHGMCDILVGTPTRLHDLQGGLAGVGGWVRERVMVRPKLAPWDPKYGHFFGLRWESGESIQVHIIWDPGHVPKNVGGGWPVCQAGWGTTGHVGEGRQGVMRQVHMHLLSLGVVDDMCKGKKPASVSGMQYACLVGLDMHGMCDILVGTPTRLHDLQGGLAGVGGWVRERVMVRPKLAPWDPKYGHFFGLRWESGESIQVHIIWDPGHVPKNVGGGWPVCQAGWGTTGHVGEGRQGVMRQGLVGLDMHGMCDILVGTPTRLHDLQGGLAGVGGWVRERVMVRPKLAPWDPKYGHFFGLRWESGESIQVHIIWDPGHVPKNVGGGWPVCQAGWGTTGHVGEGRQGVMRQVHMHLLSLGVVDDMCKGKKPASVSGMQYACLVGLDMHGMCDILVGTPTRLHDLQGGLAGVGGWVRERVMVRPKLAPWDPKYGHFFGLRWESGESIQVHIIWDPGHVPKNVGGGWPVCQAGWGTTGHVGEGRQGVMRQGLVGLDMHGMCDILVGTPTRLHDLQGGLAGVGGWVRERVMVRPKLAPWDPKYGHFFGLRWESGESIQVHIIWDPGHVPKNVGGGWPVCQAGWGTTGHVGEGRQGVMRQGSSESVDKYDLQQSGQEIETLHRGALAPGVHKLSPKSCTTTIQVYQADKLHAAARRGRSLGGDP